MALLIIIFILAIALPLIFGGIIARVVHRQLTANGKKNALLISTLVFFGCIAVMFYALFEFVSHSFYFHR